MKTNSITYNLTRKQGYSSVNKDPQMFKEKSGAGLCEKNSAGYNVNNSGSLTDKSKSAAITFQGKLFEKKWFDSFLKMVNDHNIASSAFMSLILAGLIRPATIMSLPGKKDKEDKIYASGHSIASGIIGFVVSAIATSPLDSAVKMIMDDAKTKLPIPEGGIPKGEDPSKYVKYKFGMLNKQFLKLEELKKQMQTVDTAAAKKALENKIKTIELTMKNLPEWIIAVPRAMLTIALIPLVLKYVFGLEKKKKGAKPQEAAKSQEAAKPQEQQKPKEDIKVKDAEKTAGVEGFMHTSLDDFNKGGQK